MNTNTHFFSKLKNKVFTNITSTKVLKTTEKLDLSETKILTKLAY